MRKLTLLIALLLISIFNSKAENIEKTYYFDKPQVTEQDGFHKFYFENCLQSGIAGSPELPYLSVSFLLPAGESAIDIEFIGEQEIALAGNYKIFPRQYARPISEGKSGNFTINELIYAKNQNFPVKQIGDVTTSFLSGYGFGFSAFTPIKYNPVTGTVSYFSKVTVRIKTQKTEEAEAALKNIQSSENVLNNVLSLAQNSQKINSYPSREKTADDYEMVIISPATYANNYTALIDMYLQKAIRCRVIIDTDIYSNYTGVDHPEKIRNFLIDQYQQFGIEYVLLGGDVELIPYRGFYCHVQSSSVYEDESIPSDLYFSALDGNWNTNGNNLWGEIGEDDLLPELSVARFTFNTADELQILINKSLSYQMNPVLGELNRPFLAGEHLYDDPITWGAQYLELLVGHREDNGYTTDGIYETDDIEELFDRDNGTWSPATLMTKINSGKSFIHHVGHANTTYAMRLYNSDITNSNFANVNGTTHNYTLVYTHGCICGSWDADDCIGERMVNINNFAVAFVGNTRYGWFNEGQTEGPSAHLHREFVSCLYGARENHLGTAHAVSRYKTAPWVNAPGQHEEGALRWCFYDCNIIGDPALQIWTAEPATPTIEHSGVILIGLTEYNVQISGVEFPAGYTCSIIKDGELLGIGTSDESGSVIVELFDIITEVGTVEMVVSGYNCLPESIEINIIPANTAYVTVNEYTVSDDNNNQIDYNELVNLNFSLTNVGLLAANDVNLTLGTTDPNISLPYLAVNYGQIAAGATATVSDVFGVIIADGVADQYRIPITANISDGTENWHSQIRLLVNAPVLESEFIEIDDSNANNNGQLDPGEVATLKFQVNNQGHAITENIVCNLICQSSYISIVEQQINLTPVAAGNSAEFVFNIIVDSQTPTGETVTFTMNLIAGSYSAQTSISKKVGLIIEDWESGDFSGFDWQFAGVADWQISGTAYEGESAAVSGDIDDGEISELFLTVEAASDDVVSFYKKVSSENNYDYLRFYIDNVEKGEWAGSVDWSLEEFPITAGTHILKWTYEKDGSVSTDDDCAWIDYIVLPGTGSIAPATIQFTSAPVTAATQGENYSYNISATIENSSEFPVLTSPVLPQWLTFTANANGTAVLAGSPQQSGNFNVVLQATFNGASATQSFVINVISTNSAPYFTSEPLSEAEENIPYTCQITGADPENDNLLIKIEQNPGWLSIGNTTNGTAVLSGIPSAENIGENPVILQITDGELNQNMEFIINVVERNYAPTFNSTPVETIEAGQSYLYTIQAVDNESDELTFAGNTIPAWLNFTDNNNGTATLQGIASITDIGNHNVIIQVSDNTNQAVNQEFTIQVTEPTSINQFETENFVIYPNPAQNNATVIFNATENSVMKINVINTLGESVLSVYKNYEVKEGENSISINVESLETGIYFVSFESETQIFNVKLNIVK